MGWNLFLEYILVLFYHRGSTWVKKTIRVWNIKTSSLLHKKNSEWLVVQFPGAIVETKSIFEHSWLKCFRFVPLRVVDLIFWPFNRHFTATSKWTKSVFCKRRTRSWVHLLIYSSFVQLFSRHTRNSKVCKIKYNIIKNCPQVGGAY